MLRGTRRQGEGCASQSTHFSPNSIRVKNEVRIRWDEHVARKGQKERCRGRDQVDTYRRRWEVNVIVHHKETGREGVDWIKLALGRNKGWGLLSSVTKLRFP